MGIPDRMVLKAESALACQVIGSYDLHCKTKF